MRVIVLAVLLFANVPLASAPASPLAPRKPIQDLFEGVSYRNIGPARGGRVTAVTGVRGQPMTFYQGATGGGIWKTVNGGSSWEPLGGKAFATGSVGSIAVSESDPNVIYVGMGEKCIRGNVSHGDGIYKSTDGGRSFTHMGLEKTRQIAKVIVHPKNPDLVYLAAQGHVFTQGPERGIYRSIDGGKTWKKILFVDERTGASDLSMDPSNPRILFAGFWTVERKPWALSSGSAVSGSAVSGSAVSGLFRSTDGGETWKKLTKGLPQGVTGKVGVSVSGARSGRVYALVEAEKGGLFRSDDFGDSWTLINEDNALRQRAWYYTHVFASPKSAETVYVANVRLHVSVNGGKSFGVLPEVHGDNHDLWIDPDEPSRMIKGDDGGAAVSFDSGQSWSTLDNQPTGQFYRVAVDDQYPYWVYGAQQDNTTVAMPSRVREARISARHWHPAGGCESGWMAPHPKKQGVVFSGCYGGGISRYDHKSGEDREIIAWPQLAVGQAPKNLKYRFQWNAPILVSRHDPAVLYHAAQVLLRSTDEGETWSEASPDLTRNDKSKQDYSGGPITRDNTGVELYGSIFALAESPHVKGVLWAGTDDGLVHVTRDDGKTWQDVTPKDMPQEIQINSLEISPHSPETVYIAATRYKFADDRPYLYRTADGGKTWTKIVAGIPENAFTRVVREDPVRKGLLFAGTESGIFVSFDAGGRWEPFQRNLPAVPITDMLVKDADLVVATQGRGFWILDGLTSLRAWKDELLDAELALAGMQKTVRYPGGAPREEKDVAGKNAPGGAIIDFWLKEKPADGERVTLEILKGDKVLRTFTNSKLDERKKESGEWPGEAPLELVSGMNRFVWDLRMMRPDLLPRAVLWGEKDGPRVGPGSYKVRISHKSGTVSQSFDVVANPALNVPAEDVEAQSAFLARLAGRLSEIHGMVRQIRDVKAQVDGFVARAEKLGKAEKVLPLQKALLEKLDPIEETLVNPKLKAEQDVLNFPPGLDHQFAGIMNVVSSADARPTRASIVYCGELESELARIQARLDAVLTKELLAINAALRDAGMELVMAMPASVSRLSQQ